MAGVAQRVSPSAVVATTRILLPPSATERAGEGQRAKRVFWMSAFLRFIYRGLYQISGNKALKRPLKPQKIAKALLKPRKVAKMVP